GRLLTGVVPRASARPPDNAMVALCVGVAAGGDGGAHDASLGRPPRLHSIAEVGVIAPGVNDGDQALVVHAGVVGASNSVIAVGVDVAATGRRRAGQAAERDVTGFRAGAAVVVVAQRGGGRV